MVQILHVIQTHKNLYQNKKGERERERERVEVNSATNQFDVVIFGVTMIRERHINI